MYIYCADTYCDSCGEEIVANLRAIDRPDTGDSDDFPQSAPDGEATDSPSHCGSYGACLDPIDLSDYGLAPDARLYGAESRKIGALLSDNLTEYGARYLREMISEPDSTPYQTALYRFWRETFSAYLPESEDD
jgi:hypothetical protein